MKQLVLFLLIVCFLPALAQPGNKPATNEIIYSGKGIPLSYETIYKSRKQGHCVYRNEDGVITKWGYYDDGENFWGMEFVFNQENTHKLVDVHVLQRGIQIEVLPNMQKNAVDTLTKLCKKYNDFNDHPGLSKMRRDLNPDIKNYEAIRIESEKIKRGNFLIYYMVSLVEDYLTLKIQEPLIDSYFQQISQNKLPGSKDFEDDFDAQIELAHKKTHEYRDSLEYLYYNTVTLLNDLKTQIKFLDVRKKFEKQLLAAHSFIAEKYFVSAFDKLYRESIEPLELKARLLMRYDTSADLTIINSLLREYKTYIDRYPELKSIDDSTRILAKRMRELISAKQNSSTTRSLSLLDKDLKPYFDETDLFRKIEKGKSTIKLLKSKLSELQSLTETGNLIESYLLRNKKRYLGEQPIIFKSEILPLEEQVIAYRSEESVVTKLETGRKLFLKLSTLDEQFDTILKYDTLLEQEYKNLQSVYHLQYQKIYQNSIMPLENSILNYKNNMYADIKIGIGHTLLKNFQSLRADLDTLNAQLTEIPNNLEKTGTRYKKRFPKVHKVEYSEIKAEFKEYKKTNVLFARKDMGSHISLSLRKMIAVFDTLSSLDSLINIYYHAVGKEYSSNFPGIYNKKYSVIKPQYLSYRSCGQSGKKYDQATFIWTRLATLNDQYNFLDSLDKQIDISLNLCREAYKNNMENEIIWKKGMLAFNYFYDIFHQEEDSEKIIEKAYNCIVLLNKMISISKTDNGELIRLLEKLETPEEIRNAFGI